MNFKIFLCSLLLVAFFSCEKEDSTITDVPQAPLAVKEADDQTLASPQRGFNLCFDLLEAEDVATINPCTTSFPLGPIVETLPFSHFATHDLVNELNDIFYCHEEFSTCQRAFFPQEICTITFSLYDTKMFAIPVPAYTYFSGAIVPNISNQILQYFACEMTDYGDQNYNDYRIAHVSFDQDQLLCNTCGDGIGDLLYLRATVHYYIY